MSFFDSIDEDMEGQRTVDSEASDAGKFDPSEGESLQAVLLKADLFTGGQYEPGMTITFRNVGDKKVGGIEAGESGRMFLSGVVLKRKMLEAAPAIGSPFALRYEGKVTPSSGGNPYRDWTVVTPYTRDGDTNAQDRALWDSIDPDQRGFTPKAAPSGQAQNSEDWKF